MDPLTENLLRTVYLHGDETVEGMFQRVVDYVLQDEPEHVRSDVLEEMKKLRFLPNSPTLMNAGATNGCLSACFVVRLEDSMESILTAQYKMAKIHSQGGGTGFSFSSLRPRGSKVGSGGEASGPLAFLKMFDATTVAIKQGGRRRGANMGVMDISHPDVEEFITAKRDTSQLQNFNLSVMIPDKFFSAQPPDDAFEARKLFDKIVESAWMTGEPGVLFYDRINRDNPVPSLGPIVATNPCGEIPLPSPSVCNLGSIDVAKFVKDGEVDWDDLARVIRLAVLFLDRVVDRGNYPFPELAEAAAKTRAIGLGVMGFADALLKMRVSYNSEDAVKFAEQLSTNLQRVAEDESLHLGEERGPYPLHGNGSKGRRNALLLAIAPTGSISRIAGTSSGIEPNFSWVYTQKSLEKEFEVVHPLYGSLRDKEKVPDYFVTAHEVPWEQHIKIQAAFQEHVGGGVSKTINLPHDATKEDIGKAILLAHALGCKGITVYRDGCREGQVLKVAGTGRRPPCRVGKTVEQQIGCGSLFLHVNKWDGEVREVFAQVGKEGGCPSQSSALGILLSDIAQGKTSLRTVAEDLRGIKCHSCIKTGAKVLSCPDAIARVLLNELKGEPVGVGLTNKEIEAIVGLEDDTCPDCGEPLARAGGCKQCLGCGWSRCG